MEEVTAIEELIARLEKTTGPDRNLDSDIAIAVGKQGKLTTIVTVNDESDNFSINYAADYTASIDAALTLAPEGWAWFVERIDGFTEGDARVWLPSQRTHGLRKENFDTRNAASPAIAMCIVALKARNAEASASLPQPPQPIETETRG